MLQTKLKLYDVRNSNSVNGIFYDFDAPYQEGGKISLYNQDKQDLVMQGLSFTNNVELTGDPWGSLFPWGSKMTSKPNPDNTISYNVTFPAAFTFASNKSADLSYGFEDVKGILPIGMPPHEVDVATSGNTLPVDILGACQGDQCNDPLAGKYNNFVYFTDWSQYARKYTAQDLPIGKINGVLYAFIGFAKDGSIKLLDPNADDQQLPTIFKLRQQYPYLKAFLSFGGWGLSGSFSDLAADPTARNNFAKNVIAAMKQVGFNGIDIDWEYPVENGKPEDATNFAELLTAIRDELDKQSAQSGDKYYLSIAAPAGIDKIQAIQKADPNTWPQIFKIVDYVNPMTYDYHGAWDTYSDYMCAWQTDPRDPYYSNPVVGKYDTKIALSTYLQLGCPAKKLNVGIPLYGRAAYVDELGESYGLWHKIVGTPPGQYDDTGIYDYKCIVSRQCNGYKSLPPDTKLIPANQNPYANCTLAPWGISSQEQKMVVTYGDVSLTESLVGKVKNEGIGGTFFWEASGDDSDSSNSLIDTAYRGLKSEVRKFRPTNVATRPQAVKQHYLPVPKGNKVDRFSANGKMSFQTSDASRLSSWTSWMLSPLKSAYNSITSFVGSWLQDESTPESSEADYQVVPVNNEPSATSSADYVVAVDTNEAPCFYADGSTNIVYYESSEEPTSLIFQCKLPKPAARKEIASPQEINGSVTTELCKIGSQSFVLTTLPTLVYKYLLNNGVGYSRANIAYYAVYSAVLFLQTASITTGLISTAGNAVIKKTLRGFGISETKAQWLSNFLMIAANSAMTMYFSPVALSQLAASIGGAFVGSIAGSVAGNASANLLCKGKNTFFADKALCKNNLTIWHPILGQSLNVLA